MLAKYDLEGNFHGFEDLNDQLSICDEPSESIQDLFRIGMTQRFHCHFNLSKLTSSNKFERPRIENYFFELYLRDYNDDLIDVPILIENAGGTEGGYPNVEDDMTRWVLVRRFFMYDTVSGINRNEYPDGEPIAVRYPKHMTIEVQLNPDVEEMIYVPYLRIEYRERTSAYIASTNADAWVFFGTYYKSSTVGFWEGAMTIFYVLVAVLVLIIILKTHVMLNKPSLS